MDASPRYGSIALNAPGGDVEMLYRSLAEWQMWTADVLESHVSYPMLALFRSQHPGQSWVTALGVVTDAATLTSACVEGAQSREPYFLYRRGRRAIVEISSRLHVPAAPTPPSWLVADELRAGLEPARRHSASRCATRTRRGRTCRRSRATYGDQLERLIDFLVAPRGFWGHSAEETVAEEVAQAAAEARRKARTPGSPARRRGPCRTLRAAWKGPALPGQSTRIAGTGRRRVLLCEG